MVNSVSNEAVQFSRGVQNLEALRALYARARGNKQFYEELGDNEVMVERWRHTMALCEESALLVKAREEFKYKADVIKAKLDIVEYIGRYTKLSRSGIGRYTGLCIFHHDTHPSLFVYAEKQDWYCFGCLAGGDIFNFAMLYYGRNFRDVLPILASEV